MSFEKEGSDLPKEPPYWHYLDPSQPWILGGGERAIFDDGSIDNFVPYSYRYGPWHWGIKAALAALVYVLILGVTWMRMNAPTSDGWISLFAIGDEHYEAFSVDWNITCGVFLWMVYPFVVMMRNKTIFGGMVRISFTFWSWTVMTIRHGLLVVAPWVPAARIPAEILRLPVLLSACLTFGLWNFVIFPAIMVFFIHSAEARKNFALDFLGFHLINFHVFNIVFAISNAAMLAPVRPMHLGDLAAAFTMLMLYAAFYLLILDRLGVHLYPILSPRSIASVVSLALILGIWVGGYNYWKENYISRDLLVQYLQ